MADDAGAPTFKIQRDLWLIDLIFNTRELSREEAIEMERELTERSQTFLRTKAPGNGDEVVLLGLKASAAVSLARMYAAVRQLREDERDE